MAKSLSPWCKDAKKAMIDKDLSVQDLAKGVGFTREYVSAIVNGRQYSTDAINKISQYLEINTHESYVCL